MFYYKSFYICPCQRKKLGLEYELIPVEISDTFGEDDLEAKKMPRKVKNLPKSAF